jgi:hypothetical protein
MGYSSNPMEFLGGHARKTWLGIAPDNFSGKGTLSCLHPEMAPNFYTRCQFSPRYWHGPLAGKSECFQWFGKKAESGDFGPRHAPLGSESFSLNVRKGY